MKKIFYQLISEAEKNRPDIVLLMDYPDFNLRLARQLKSMGIKVFYYISPQVWAWRKSRIHDIKAYCEKVFLLFPFEKKFYETYQVPYEFVGHPLLDDLNPDLFNIDKINFQRSRYGIQSHEKVLALMPGSRRGEVDQHFQIQQAVARNLLKMHNHLRILICVAPPLSKEYMIQKLENFNLPYILLKEDPNHMIAISDYVLVASGTATLMVGLLEKPMVIMYKMNWITGVIGNFLTRGLKFFGLVNLILDEEVVPERKQQFVQVDELTKLMNRFIVDSTYTRKTIEKLKILKTSLGDRGANGRVVSALNKYL